MLLCAGCFAAVQAVLLHRAQHETTKGNLSPSKPLPYYQAHCSWVLLADPLPSELFLARVITSRGGHSVLA